MYAKFYMGKVKIKSEILSKGNVKCNRKTLQLSPVFVCLYQPVYPQQHKNAY